MFFYNMEIEYLTSRLDLHSNCQLCPIPLLTYMSLLIYFCFLFYLFIFRLIEFLVPNHYVSNIFLIDICT